MTGHELQQARKRLHMTQPQFAERVDYAVETVNRAERGKVAVSDKLANRTQALLDATRAEREAARRQAEDERRLRDLGRATAASDLFNIVSHELMGV